MDHPLQAANLALDTPKSLQVGRLNVRIYAYRPSPILVRFAPTGGKICWIRPALSHESIMAYTLYPYRVVVKYERDREGQFGSHNRSGTDGRQTGS